MTSDVYFPASDYKGVRKMSFLQISGFNVLHYGIKIVAYSIPHVDHQVREYIVM